LVAAGERVTYTVRVTNTDALASPNLLVDVLPLPEDYFVFWGVVPPASQANQVDGVAYGLISGSAGTIDYTGGISWTGQLSPGAGMDFSYWVQMPLTMTTPKNHTTGVDIYDADAAAWLTWAPAGAYMRPFSTSATTGFTAFTKKLTSKAEVLPSETFTYTISMLNPSSVVQAIKVTDTLPLDVTFVSATGGATYDAGSHTVYWSGSVPGTSLTPTTFDIVVTMAPNASVGSSVVNDASFYNGVSNALITTKSASTSVLPSADLVLNKTSNRLLGSLGQTIKYTLVLKNEGPNAANPATLLDMVPAEVGVVGSSITSTKASLVPLWNASNRTVNWQGALSVGEVVTVTYDAVINVGSPEGLAVINLAKLSAPNAYDTVFESALTEVIFGHKLFLPIVLR
jgi:uncharacterized repeat protein (TIGR01451 family)